MGILILDKLTQGISPLIMVFKKKCFNDFFIEFNNDSCVQVLYTKKTIFVTKIAYIQDKILPKPQKLQQECL